MTLVTPEMLDAAYRYLESLSSMVGMAPEQQVKAVLAQVYRLMDAKRPAPVTPPVPLTASVAPAWTPPVITIPK
jgi:hypothetical protein